jgi:hypothetical protein
MNERLVFGPKAVVARDEQQATMLAVLDREEHEEMEHIDRLRLTVLVRPFLTMTPRVAAHPPTDRLDLLRQTPPPGLHDWQHAAQVIADSTPSVTLWPARAAEKRDM